jgi:flagellar hook-associated protein 2
MAGITGIGSGIDIDGIVKATVAAQAAPKTAQLARLETSTTTKFSALGELTGALNTFQTALEGLDDVSLFEKRTATSSLSGSVTASAEKTALAGSYQVAVQRLATSSRVATGAVTSSYAASESGVLNVKLGAADTAGVSVDIAAGDTLVQVRDKLNTALKDKGISANIVNDPANGTSRLVLSAKETGAGKDIIVSTDSVTPAGSPDMTLGALVVDSSVIAGASTGGYLGEQAGDAVFTIDGLTQTSASNSIDGVIPGVTFTLLGKTEAGKPATLTVGQDTSGVSANIKKFVTAYNALIATTNKLTSVTSVGEDKKPVLGGLVGDSSIRNLLSGVRNELSSPAAQDGIRMLTDMGITTQKDGTLAIDDEKMATALDENFDAVGSFFTGDSGLMSRMSSRVDGYIKPGGLLETRMDGLQATRSDIDTQKENLTRRMDQLQTRLYAQFNAMDSMVAQLSNTSDWLAQALDSLPGVVRNKK